MKMRWYKVKALMARDLKIYKRARWKIVDSLYFPVTTVIMWGLFAIYSREFATEAGLMVLVVNVFWSFSYLSQSITNHSMNEDSYSGSFKQLLVSGISEFEYIIARIFSSTITSLLIMCVMLTVSFLFGFVALIQAPGLIISLIGITLISSIALSVMIAALIIFLGRAYGFLAWTLLQAFILLSAPFFPLKILPYAVQMISLAMPYTRVFIGVRSLVEVGTISGTILMEGLLVSIVYLLVCYPLYKMAFSRARRTGELVRMM
jgi:ABC-type polysaccharide/polyol phosphate export permease